MNPALQTALVLISTVAAPHRPAVQARIDYTLEYKRAPSAGSRHVQIESRGLPRGHRAELYLQNWGEWLEGPDYLSQLSCEPPLSDPTRSSEKLLVETPNKWNGELADGR